jgi:hypothetical protein
MPTENQVGGTHYKECKIQPVEYIHANKLGFLEGNIVKYITRHRTKGEGATDILKVKHYADLILQLDYDMTTEEDDILLSQEVHSTWNPDST